MTAPRQHDDMEHIKWGEPSQDKGSPLKEKKHCPSREARPPNMTHSIQVGGWWGVSLCRTGDVGEEGVETETQGLIRGGVDVIHT